jgi:ATP-binding cassette subfamily B protein
MYFAVALGAGVFRFLMRHAVIGISRHVEFDLRNELFAHLQRLSLRYFQSTRTGELMARATNDLAAVRMMLGRDHVSREHGGRDRGLDLLPMLRISPRLTLLSLLPLPLVSLSMWYFGDRIHRGFEEIQEHFARLTARVQENLAGVRVVRVRARGERSRRVRRYEPPVLREEPAPDPRFGVLRSVARVLLASPRCSRSTSAASR